MPPAPFPALAFSKSLRTNHARPTPIRCLPSTACLRIPLPSTRRSPQRQPPPDEQPLLRICETALAQRREELLARALSYSPCCPTLPLAVPALAPSPSHVLPPSHPGPARAMPCLRTTYTCVLHARAMPMRFRHPLLPPPPAPRTMPTLYQHRQPRSKSQARAAVPTRARRRCPRLTECTGNSEQFEIEGTVVNRNSVMYGRFLLGRALETTGRCCRRCCPCVGLYALAASPGTHKQPSLSLPTRCPYTAKTLRRARLRLERTLRRSSPEPSTVYKTSGLPFSALEVLTLPICEPPELPELSEKMSQFWRDCIGSEFALYEDKNPDVAATTFKIRCDGFLEFLWLRSNCSSEDAAFEGEMKKLLLSAQMKLFHAYASFFSLCEGLITDLKQTIPPEHMEISALDEDSEEEEYDSEYDSEYDDSEYDDSEYDDSGECDNGDDNLNFGSDSSSVSMESVEPPPKPRQPTKQPVKRVHKALPCDEYGRVQLCCDIKTVAEAFFAEGDKKKPRSKIGVVEDLRTLRYILSCNIVQESGLASFLQSVTVPGNGIELVHPDVELSFRCHDWRTSYGAILQALMSADPYRRPERIQIDECPLADDWLDLFDPLFFLQFLSLNADILPWRSNTMAIFLFVSAINFAANWNEWLLACLQMRKFPRVDQRWDPVKLYRKIQKLPVLKDKAALDLQSFSPKLHIILHWARSHREWMDTANLNARHPVLAAPQSPSFTPSLSTSSTVTNKQGNKGKKTSTARLAKKHQKSLKKQLLGLAQNVTSSSAARRSRIETRPWLSGCKRCKDLEEDFKCLRHVYVDAKSAKLLRKLKGRPLTEAEGNDRLPSLEEGVKLDYIEMKNLPFDVRTIRPRPFVLERGCSHDITRIIHKKTNKLVGAIRYSAFSPAMLQQLQDHHRLVAIQKVKRRAFMQATAYGSMTAFGVRQPAGGLAGDTYAPYAKHEAETQDGIETLFRVAQDAECLDEMARSLNPSHKHDLEQLGEETGITRLGSQVGTTFYCTNYMNPPHEDDDASPGAKKCRRSQTGVADPKLRRHVEDNLAGGMLQPCMQTEKSGCKPGEFDFVMLKWGIRFETHTNAVWLFNGQELHGTVMPSQSTMSTGNAVSRGTHKTVRRRDAVS
ncbi:hypothetical protein GGX14DRAFT_553424 [Mycena pura]|uniref:Uncharacterized protein n=1 Tax=Mycena pura TaxID=153505 RepID=A0AAD6YUK9_9AGAR|nr:hypothetical protein GGX14DRAFT_553424 [Mycena pura]